MESTSAVGREMLEHALETVFADWLKQLDLRVLDAQAGEGLLALPVSERHVQLQTTFLRPVPADSGVARVHARVLRMGNNLVFGDIHITTADELLAAHATTTYALL